MCYHDPMNDTGGPVRLRDLRNLGARSEAQLHAVGVTSAEQLDDIGPEAAYRRLRERFGGAISPVYLYALEAALLDVTFTDLPPERRNELLQIARTINAELAAG